MSSTVCYKCTTCIAPSYLCDCLHSALLLLLLSSRFLEPYFPLLVPALFSSSVTLHGMTLSFLIDRNTLSVHWNITSFLFSKTKDLLYSAFGAAITPPPPPPAISPYLLFVLYCLEIAHRVYTHDCEWVCVCVCVCVSVCARACAGMFAYRDLNI